MANRPIYFASGKTVGNFPICPTHFHPFRASHRDMNGSCGTQSDCPTITNQSNARSSRWQLREFACCSPKVRLLCIFNDFIKLPDACTGDAMRWTSTRVTAVGNFAVLRRFW